MGKFYFITVELWGTRVMVMGVECMWYWTAIRYIEEVDCFKYLGSQVATDGGWERDVVHRMNEEYIA